MKFFDFAAIALVTLVIGKSLAAVAHSGDVSASGDSVLDVLKAKNVTIFLQLVADTNLTKDLAESDPVTVFAPSDAALLALPATVRERIVRDHNYAVDFVKYHILSANMTSTNMTQDSLTKTMNEKKIRFNVYTVNKQTFPVVNGVRFIKADLMAKNGVVHMLEKVLYPEMVDNIFNFTLHHSDLTLFHEYIIKAKVSLTGPGPFTVFAPTNQAFKKYSGKTGEAMVQYHVVNGNITLFSAGMTNNMKLTTEKKGYLATIK